MSRKFRPIPYEEFPTDKETIRETNCLAFALGIKQPRRTENEYTLEMSVDSIDKIFLEKIKTLGYEPKDFKRIERHEEKCTNKYIIRVYGFEAEEFIDEGIQYHFHVIRRELNGEWVHKPGFRFRARKISEEDWTAIFERYGNRFVSFAVDA